VEEVLALSLHHEDTRDDNPRLGGGGLFLCQKWLAEFLAGLADLFPSSSPGCESEDIFVGETRADLGLGE
jgi:hypothetical protein